MTSSGTTFTPLTVPFDIWYVSASVAFVLLISKPGVIHSAQFAPAVQGMVCDHKGEVVMVANVPVPDPLAVEKIHDDEAAVEDWLIDRAVPVPTRMPVFVLDTGRRRNVMLPFDGYAADDRL